MVDFLSDEFWNERYQKNETGWDLNEISAPIKSYFDKIDNRELKILIPGCGRAHEAEYLYRKGFKNVHILDFATQAIEDFKKRVPDFPDSNIYIGDFFQHEGKYDVIIEQTLFCAIDPKLRKDYAQKMYSSLNEGGLVVGVLFGVEMHDGPPFGGSKKEYHEYFDGLFKNVIIEDCYNSIKPRMGRELFIRLRK